MIEWEFLGSLNMTLFQAWFGELNTDEIIVTHERVEHIKEHHLIDFDLFAQHGADCVQDPDYIIEDCKHIGTVFMAKRLSDINLNVVVRLSLQSDAPHLKNSVMTFFRIRDRNLEKLIQKNRLLYKKE